MDSVFDAVDERLQKAVKYALKSVAVEQPEDPLKFVAEKIKEYGEESKIECPKPLEKYEISEEEMSKIKEKESYGRQSAVSASSIREVDVADVYKTIEEEEKIQEIMKRIPILANLGSEILVSLSKVMEEKVIDSGEMIIQQGFPCSSFYIMLQGSCSRIENNREIATYSTDDAFGELFLFHYSISSFSIQAKEKLSVWTITRPVFQRIIYDEIQKKEKQYLIYLNKFNDLDNLTDTQKIRLLDSIEIKDVKTNEVVFGDDTNTENISYIIDQGEFEISNEEHTILKQGDVFGAYGWSGVITAITPGRIIIFNHNFVQILL